MTFFGNFRGRFIAAAASIIFPLFVFAADFIKGRVTDASDGSPIPGVSVMTGVRGVVTNSDGYYAMPLPDKAQGNVSLSFSCVGYVKQSITVDLAKAEGRSVNIALKTDENLLREAIVQGRKHDFGVKSPQMSAVALSEAQIKAVPMVYGEPDLLKTIQRLPGVQSGKEGNSGIMVRGGSYDQNQLMLDGAELFSTSHLKGFVTAVNPDIISSMVFYRGAFPARYGGKLSSVIDVEAAEGDFYSYHGAVSAGLMMGRAAVSGPIVKGRTSFAVAGRLSYFDMIFQPEAEKHYRKIGIESPYSGMEFWDLNLKLAHRLSANDKLTLLLVTDRDRHTTKSTKNYPKTYTGPYYDPDRPQEQIAIGEVQDYSFSNPGEMSTHWGNNLGSLNWYHIIDDTHSLHTQASFSNYSYRRKVHGEQESSHTIIIPGKADSTSHASKEITDIVHRSVVNCFKASGDYQFSIDKNHRLNAGAEIKYVVSDPRRKIISERDEYGHWSVWQSGELLLDRRNIHRHTSVDSLVGNVCHMVNSNIYITDRFNAGPVEAILGVRLASYSVSHKTYLSVEPRLSASLSLGGMTSVKASFCRMSQGERLLSSTSLVSPSDVWVSVTDSIPPMKSNIYSLSVNRQLPQGIEVSVEGYYKTISDMTDYREGTDFSRVNDDWEQMVVLGKCKSYGVELMLQRTEGKTNGWIAYTWSKAINKYDRPGQSINGGKEYFSPADRRHNLSVNLTQRFDFDRYPGNHLDISCGFFYATGRRTTIPDHLSYSAMLDMYDHSYVSTGISSYSHPHISTPHHISDSVVLPAEAFDVYLRYKGYGLKNNFKFPDEIRLDLMLSMTVKHLVGESTVAVGATNLLNRKNVSDAFIGSDRWGRVVLKGVCNFPIMPVISYTYSF